MVGMALPHPACTQQQRTAVVLQHAADCVHDNRTAANQRCTAGMNGWHGLLAEQCTTRQRTAVALLTQQIVYMITAQPQSKMHGWNASPAGCVACTACTHAAA
jgi:hypothetical protein